MKQLLLAFIFIITLTACSNDNQGADPPDDMYLEGVVLKKNTTSVELELFGSSRDITENITVNVNNKKNYLPLIRVKVYLYNVITLNGLKNLKHKLSISIPLV